MNHHTIVDRTVMALLLVAVFVLPNLRAMGDACCLPDDTCQDASQFQCDFSGGVIIPGVDCASDPCGPPPGPTTWYVDSANCPGPGDGSVGDPFCSIQAAVDAAAVDDDDVEIAAGTYSGAGNIEIDLLGKNLSIRSASGNAADVIVDCQGVGRAFSFGSGETSAATLEGITIRNGLNQTGTCCGAISISGGASPAIINCVFEDCVAQDASGGNGSTFGGAIGVFADAGSPTVSGCSFTACSATSGGAIYAQGSITINDSAFDNNAAEFGAGILILGNSTVTGSTFTGNAAANSGGGIYADSPAVDIAGCSIEGNTAAGGGGIINFQNMTVNGCAFHGNHVSSSGGAMFNLSAGLVTVVNSIFTGNTAAQDGGAMDVYDCDVQITNCTIVGNSIIGTPISGGGGILIEGAGIAVMTNCIVRGNTGPGSLEEAQVYVEIGAAAASYSNIEGLSTIFGDGNVDADAQFIDPDGADDDSFTYGDNDYRLDRHSPCIDSGDALLITLPNEDLDGNPRRYDDANVMDTGNGIAPIVDMGAYERQFNSPTTTITVLVGESIQDAINSAFDGDTVELEAGTHAAQTVNFNGKAITVRSVSGDPADTIIDGGGALHVVQCVSGEGAGSVLDGVTITGGNAAGSFGTPDAYGGGMYSSGSTPTVTNCIVTGNTANSGGGMYNIGSNPTVTDCTFSSNVAIFGGGMMNTTSSSPTVTSCVFIANLAAGGSGGGMYNKDSSHATVMACTFDGNNASDGGGIYNRLSNPTVTDCVFNDNVGGGGGGMYNDYSHPSVIGCAFNGNASSAGGGGGGMFNFEISNPTLSECSFIANTANYGGGIYGDDMVTITHCTFSSNSATTDGGGIYLNYPGVSTLNSCRLDSNTAGDAGGGVYCYGSNLSLVNCTLSGNAAGDGGGMHTNFGNPSVTNCVVWGNTPDQITGESGTWTVSFSDVEGGWSGSGSNNIDADPLFVDAANGDYRFGVGSPAIDAGDNAAVPIGVTVDLDGNVRFVQGLLTGNGTMTVDLGAYEYQPDCDGNGTSDVEDFAAGLVTDVDGDGFPDQCLGGTVVNATQGTLHGSIAEAISLAANGNVLIATAAAFDIEQSVDLSSSGLTLQSVSAITQPAGGLYDLGDDATLRTATGFDMTLNGQLRVGTGDASAVEAGILATSSSGALVVRTGSALDMSAPGGVSLAGETELFPGATMTASHDVSMSGSSTFFGGTTFIGGGLFTNSGDLTALEADISADTIVNEGAVISSGTLFLTDGLTNSVGATYIGHGEFFCPVLNNGAITYIGDSVAVGDYTNNGTTTVQIGTLTVIGSLINNGTIIGDLQSTAVAGNGGGTMPGDGLSIAGDYMAGPNSSLIMPDPVWRMTVTGDFDVAINDIANFDMSQAELRLNGTGVQHVEIMGAADGAFTIGTLTIGAGSTVELVNDHNNSGQTEVPEAIYVTDLIVPAGATLMTNGMTLFAETAEIDGTVDDPENVVVPAVCIGDTDGNGAVDVDDLVSVILDWGTDGSGHNADIDDSGVVDVDDLVSVILAWGPC